MQSVPVQGEYDETAICQWAYTVEATSKDRHRGSPASIGHRGKGQGSGRDQHAGSVGLDPRHRHRHAYGFSGGQRQRMAIARCAYLGRCAFATDTCAEVEPDLAPTGVGTVAACLRSGKLQAPAGRTGVQA